MLRSIQSRLVILSLVAVAIPGVLINVFYLVRLSADIEEQYHSVANQTVGQVARDFGAHFQTIEETHKAIISHTLAWLDDEQNPAWDYRGIVGFSALKRQLQAVSASLPFVDGVFVANLDWQLVAASIAPIRASRLLDEIPLAVRTGTGSLRHFAGPHLRSYAMMDRPGGREVLTEYRRLHLISHPDMTVVVQIDIPTSEVRHALAGYAGGHLQRIALVERNGGSESGEDNAREDRELVVFENQDDVSAPFPGNAGDSDSELHEVRSKVGGTVLDVVGYYSDDRVLAAFDRWGQVALAVIGLVLLYGVVVSAILTRSMARPVINMADTLEKIGAGEMDRRLESPEVTELQELADGVNTMLDQIQALHGDNVRREVAQHRAEVEALQARINPHFLFNTLETVRGLAIGGRAVEAANGCKLLSRVFRYSVRCQQPEVTLREEMAVVGDYLDLQKLRFGDRVEVSVPTDSALDDVLVLRLIIQPVVENVFLHALEDKVKRVTITIAAETAEGAWANGAGPVLRLSVVDNGVGMPDQERRKLESRFREHRTKGVSEDVLYSRGLTNVDARLMLFYGPESGVRLVPKADGGTHVDLLLPLKWDRGTH